MEQRDIFFSFFLYLKWEEALEYWKWTLGAVQTVRLGIMNNLRIDDRTVMMLGSAGNHSAR